MDTYEYHKIANMYPMAMPSEFDLLKQSINNKGQIQSIILYDGKILDGRNRYKACTELSIEPKYEEFLGNYDEALKYSCELNSGRRNLDKSQKAMVAAYNIETHRTDGISKLTIQQASNIYGVSDRYIKRALKILNDNLAIAEQIFEGHETIGKAEVRIKEIEGKHDDIYTIESNVANCGAFELDDELTDLYTYLFSLTAQELVSIIIKSGYVKKKGN